MVARNLNWISAVSRRFLFSFSFFFMRSLSSREFCNREIRPVLTYRANGVVHFTFRVRSLFASLLAIVCARFFERGSRTVIIRFPPPIQGGWKRSHE